MHSPQTIFADYAPASSNNEKYFSQLYSQIHMANDEKYQLVIWSHGNQLVYYAGSFMQNKLI